MKNYHELEIQYADPSTLIPHHLKQHPPEQVAKIRAAIREAGKFDQPIVVDENYCILKGVGRRLAAIEEGLPLVPIVVREGLTETQKRAIRIADNKVAESPWELDALLEELQTLESEGYDLELTGFTDEDIAALESLIEPENAGNGKRFRSSAPKPPRSSTIENRCKLGDIWRLDRHYIYVGSCLDREGVDELLGLRQTEDVNIVWADPPYGMKCQKSDGQVGSNSKKYLPVAGDESIEVALKSFAEIQQRAVFCQSFQIWWGANHYGGVPPSSCWLVWDKMNGDNDFADAELAWTNGKGAVRIYQQLWNGALRSGEASGKERVHPNQKPVELARWAFLKYGDICSTIFDPFLGSGCSILAAEDDAVEATVFGCEIVPEYCAISIERWENLTGKVAELHDRMKK